MLLPAHTAALRTIVLVLLTTLALFVSNACLLVIPLLVKTVVPAPMRSMASTFLVPVPRLTVEQHVRLPTLVVANA